MTDFETLKSTLKEEILKELSFKTEGHELKTRKTKKNEKNVTNGTPWYSAPLLVDIVMAPTPTVRH